MLNPRFDELLAELLQAFVAYNQIPRRPDTVAKLAHGRWYLEAVRKDIAEERERLERSGLISTGRVGQRHSAR